MRNPDLQYLSDRWEPLVEYRIPGTPRPWREMTRWIPEDLLDTMADTSPAPLSVGTLALIMEVTGDVKGWLREAGKPLGGSQTVREGLSLLDGMIGRQEPVQGSWAGCVALWASVMARKVKLHLGEVPDGQRLKAFCPWCWTDRLVIRCLPSPAGSMLEGGEPFVRCESGVCAPGGDAVGSWWEGLPCWPMPQWVWLNEQLEAHPWNSQEKGHQQTPADKIGVAPALIHS